jgi:spermidine synthase
MVRLKSKVRNLVGRNAYEKLSVMKKRVIFQGKHLFRSPVLADLGRVYWTDKVDSEHTFGGMSYLDIYEKYFGPLRHKQIHVLEIGVKDGASLRTWEAYFPNARIYGVDIDPGCKQVERGRIAIEIGSQDDKAFLQTCFGEKTAFDIIIDDGSHINAFTLASFEHLFHKRLKPGGIYIIEDLACSYEKLQTTHNVLSSWPGMQYNDPRKNYDNDRSVMDAFFLDSIYKLDHLQGSIMALHFWPMVCIILKV